MVKKGVHNKLKGGQFNAFIHTIITAHKLVYDQTQSSAHPCVPRPKLQGLEGSPSTLQSGRWS